MLTIAIQKLAVSFLGLINIKNKDSRFIGTNPELAKLLGWKPPEELVGKSNFDPPCGVAEFAGEFVKMDKAVINSGQKMLAIDIQHYSTGWGTILTEKNPIKNNNNEISGILNPLIDVTNISIFDFYFKLYQIDKRWLGKGMTPASYILSNFYCSWSLTEKQENCLFLLVRGKSIKQIAKTLKISPRTVESHFDAIKIKLNAENKSAIIEKAIDKGFLFYIPQNFQNSYLTSVVEEN